MNVGNLVRTEYGHLGQLMEINGNEAVVDVWNYGIERDTEYSDIRKCEVVESDEDEIAKYNTTDLKKEKAISIIGIQHDPGILLSSNIMKRLELNAKDALEQSSKIKYIHGPIGTESKNPTLCFSFHDIQKLILDNCEEKDKEYIELKLNWFLEDVNTKDHEFRLKPIRINDEVYIDWISWIDAFNLFKKPIQQLPIVAYIRESVDMREPALNRKYFKRVVI